MKAMILAAGLGTRLKPLTNTTPKALLLVNRQPLIVYSLQLLRKFGILEVLINLHHLGEFVERELGNGEKFGMKITYSWEPQVLGTGGGVKKGGPFFSGERFLVINSDILIDVNLKQLMLYHKKKKGIATMVVRPREPESPHTAVILSRGNRIAQIGAEEKKEDSFLYTGVQILEPSFLRYLSEDRESCIIREGYLPALAAGEKIYGFPYKGYWNDLGTVDRYRQAENDLISGKIRLSFI